MSIFTYDMYMYIYIYTWIEPMEIFMAFGEWCDERSPKRKGMNHDEPEKKDRGYLDDWDGLFGLPRTFRCRLLTFSVPQLK